VDAQAGHRTTTPKGTFVELGAYPGWVVVTICEHTKNKYKNLAFDRLQCSFRSYGMSCGICGTTAIRNSNQEVATNSRSYIPWPIT